MPVGQNVGEDTTPLEKRVQLARRRWLSSSEYEWLYLQERRRSRRIAPLGAASFSYGLDPATRDAIHDLPPKLNARVAIVTAARFKPSDYIGVSAAAKACGNQDWIAWEILPYLEWLSEYASTSSPDLFPLVMRRLTDARAKSRKFLTGRVASRPDLTIKVRAVINNLVDGTLNSRPSTKEIEGRTRDRERINALLQLPSAWEPLPPLPNVALAIVTDMRAQGATPPEIMRALREKNLMSTPEAQEIRRENLQWIQDQIDLRFNSDMDQRESATEASTNQPAASASKPTQEIIVVSPGAPPTERQVRIGRARSAYLEAHGDVEVARKALNEGGHKIGRATFYEYLNMLDEQEPGWRSAFLLSGESGIPDGSRLTRSRRKREANDG